MAAVAAAAAGASLPESETGRKRGGHILENLCVPRHGVMLTQ